MNVCSADVERAARGIVEAYRKLALDGRFRHHRFLERFPFDACQNSSFALGHIFKEFGLGTGIVMNGQLSDPTRYHEWLTLDGLVVDATSDQFEGFDWFVGPGPHPMDSAFVMKAPYDLSEWQAHDIAAHKDIRAALVPYLREHFQIQDGG